MGTHQYVLVESSLHFYHRLEQGPIVLEYNNPKVILNESITKERLELLFHLVYCAKSKDFKLGGTKMHKYGPKVVDASSQYFLPKHVKQACIVEMKSITSQNCGEALKAMEVSENKHYDFFYSEHGLQATSMEFLATEC